MEVDNFMLGRTMGGILRLENAQGICAYNDATIYGLINGIEPFIDEFFSIEL
ncbi:hypothetical protein [Heliorestis convoluta]|uniref:hypothetical protein n=1 Tax=Heliorestis convoluta TaxID=356322 RepID=UPI00129BC5C2|nr:hypothetical protein [Heliorestis convoluta]